MKYVNFLFTNASFYFLIMEMNLSDTLQLFEELLFVQLPFKVRKYLIWNIIGPIIANHNIILLLVSTNIFRYLSEILKPLPIIVSFTFLLRNPIFKIVSAPTLLAINVS